MISAQQGVEFSTDADDPVKYGNIKKVYSIWICTDTAQKRANSIERYAINRSMLAGSNADDPRYDILNAIIINISGKHDAANTNNGLIRMLTDLFDERIDGVGKVEKLKGYGLKLTKEVEREVTDMCTYATAMENRALVPGTMKAGQRSCNYNEDAPENSITLVPVTMNTRPSIPVSMGTVLFDTPFAGRW